MRSEECGIMVSPCGDDYFSSGKFAMPQNRYALCGFTFI